MEKEMEMERDAVWLTVVNRSRDSGIDEAEALQEEEKLVDQPHSTLDLTLSPSHLHNTSITLPSSSCTARPVRMTISRQPFCFHVCQRQSCRSRLPPAHTASKQRFVTSLDDSQIVPFCICTQHDKMHLGGTVAEMAWDFKRWQTERMHEAA